ncbi:Cof-type HAD-IIB family hydrolase [Cytobacillus sp. FJAT-54145]|uniref:Cof-type HAD-IIB family hydrolase n=1 Tax=Cytobacillus spartinae TaxID=3299023 RepID=A0ABW6KIT1_9BACI
MTRNIKLIALDMDGTLLNEKDEISPENRKAIKAAEEKGVSVVLSTGRSIATCKDHFQSLKLSSYLITVNGSEIWDSNGELVERNLVETELIQWMWDLSQEHKTKFWATSCGNVWNNEMPDDITAHDWLKFGFEIEEDEIRELILNQLRNSGKLEITNSSLTNIEANAIGINKAKGIQKVCNLLGISMEEVMACGDSLNDLAMIEQVGLGIAMGNAQPLVKEAADWVTGTNNESGVAQAIHKWVLNE